MAGLLEALSAAIGEALNEAGGIRFTRLTTPWAEGVPTAFVESLSGWPASGVFFADGVRYDYASRTNLQLNGITWSDGVTPMVGAKKDLPVETNLLDWSKTYSAVDNTIQNLFVNSASGESLSVIGRNLGIERPPALDDDEVFRQVIKALAYAPKGTMYGLELALTAFFGAGNFEIRENYALKRNTVFIRVTGGLYVPLDESGQAYLTTAQNQVLNVGAKTLTMDLAPLVAMPGKVQGVRLAPENQTTVFGSVNRPSAGHLDVRYPGDAGVQVWTYSGVNELTNVTPLATDDGSMQFVDNSAAGKVEYFHTARIRPESLAAFELHLRPEILFGTLAGFQASVKDGARDLCVGLIKFDGFNTNIGFISPATGLFLAGVAMRLSNSQYYAVTIRKNGAGRVYLLVNNAVIQTADITDFDATALNEFRFGCAGTTGATQGADVRVKHASFFAVTATDFWNVSGTAGASTGVAAFDTNSTLMVPGTDVGKNFRTFAAAAPVNNGNWLVLTVPNTDEVTLGGALQHLALVESANPSRVRIAGNAAAFKYPDDVGKRIDITAAVTAPNAGTYVIANVLDPVLLTPITGAFEAFSDVVEVTASPGFITETEIDWRLLPNFTVASPISWELSTAGSVTGLVLTLRANPVINIPGGYDVIMEVIFAPVTSGHLTPGVEIVNEFLGGAYTWHPFYLPESPLGPFEKFLDELTVAGVIPEVTF